MFLPPPLCNLLQFKPNFARTNKQTESNRMEANGQTVSLIKYANSDTVCSLSLSHSLSPQLPPPQPISPLASIQLAKGATFCLLSCPSSGAALRAGLPAARPQTRRREEDNERGLISMRFRPASRAGVGEQIRRRVGGPLPVRGLCV